MTYATAKDGTKLYYEETGSGLPVVFVHEYAGDYRSWETQVRFLSRNYRCIAMNARGYPPSDVPKDDASYSQDTAREDVIAVIDAAGGGRAHVVGLSMGAYTTLHVGLVHPGRCLSLTVAGCGWGSNPETRAENVKLAEGIAKMFREEGIESAGAKYADFAMRQQFKHKDPRGWSEFEGWLKEHSAEGHANTMLGLQLTRPTLWDLKDRLTQLRVPTLVIVGDEDEACLDGSVLLKRTIPTAGLLVMPRAGHTINSEEPAAFNVALADFFMAVEHRRWMTHRTPQFDPPHG